MKQAAKLVDHVDYGLLEFEPETAEKLEVSIADGKVLTKKVTKQESANDPRAKNFVLFAKPVAGSKPLFLIENSKTHQQIISTDPYFFVPQKKIDLQFPQDHPFAKYYSDVTGYSLEKQHSRWKALLGFGYQQKPKTGNWAPLSSVLDKSKFPATTQFHLDLWVEANN